MDNGTESDTVVNQLVSRQREETVLLPLPFLLVPNGDMGTCDASHLRKLKNLPQSTYTLKAHDARKHAMQKREEAGI